ncbi:hypothetical protein Tco_0017592 [Tanacetum coccineum]
MPHDSPLLGGYTPGSDEGSMKLNEMTELCTKLFDKVTNLEKDLNQTKKVYGKALTKLVKRVKHLEDMLKSTIERRKAGWYSDDDEDWFDLSIKVQLERVKTYKVTLEEDVVLSLEYSMLEVFLVCEEILSTDERITQKLNEEEMAKAAAREDQERIDFEKALDSRKRVRYNQKISNTQEETSICSSSKEEYDDLFKEHGWIQDELLQRNKVTEETLLQESFKKLRAAEASRSEPIQEQQTKESQELSEEELQKLLVTVPVEEIYVEALQVKYTIINWEVYNEESRFDRDDSEKLWKLVKGRFNTTVPTNDQEKELWVELKRLFEPDDNDILWKLQRYMHDPLN